MYKVGKRNNAHAHGTYIKPVYVDVWRIAVDIAAAQGVSISEFVNYGLFVLLTGHEPSDSKLTGRTPFSKGARVLKIEEGRRKRDFPVPVARRRFHRITGRK